MRYTIYSYNVLFMKISSKYTLFLLTCSFALAAVGFDVPPVAAATSASDLQTQIDAANQQIVILNQQIAQYQAALTQAGADKKTLQSAIKSLDLQRSKVEAQITLTQSQINTTQLQIQQLGDQIQTTNQTIATYKNALAEALRDMSHSDNQPLFVQLFLSGSLSNFWQNIDEIFKIQDAFSEKAQELQTQEKNLADEQTAVQQKKDSLSAQNQTLASQQQSLSATVKSKNQLLIQTNNKESTYQKLLAQAEAQVKSFSNFTKNAGGTGLLSNQTICDSWGCYYNQRDTAWGRQSLNGTGYTLASDGCLVTAMAMVMTHYGYHSVTPATINADPDNFATYYPAYLLNSITAGGVNATRVTTAIDGTLASGTPVIVGMNVSGGTHFVVLVSGSNGNYIMRDPYVANGKDIAFTSHYSVREIYSITKVVIGS